METAELEYRLLKDKCNSVINELIKCRKQIALIPGKESADGSISLSATINPLRNNYFFTAPDYLSVIDHLASDVKITA